MEKTYEVKPNTGSLHVSKSKKSPKAPDYFGEIVIDLNAIEHDGNLVKVKLGGWKAKSKTGYSYLSLMVDTWKPDFIKKDESANQGEIEDDEIPF